jgi:hypothetical protein
VTGANGLRHRQGIKPLSVEAMNAVIRRRAVRRGKWLICRR